MSKSYKNIDLSYLKQMTDNSKELIIEMVDIFKLQTPEFIEKMAMNYKNNDWEGLADIAHKAKSSVAVLGMNQLSDDLKELEISARNKENIEKYPIYLSKFKNVCLEALDELNDAVSNL